MPKRFQANPSLMLADARAHTLVARAIGQRKDCYPSAQVLGTLAIELTLKAVAQITRGSFQGRHDLWNLFHDLPREIRERILEAHRELASTADEEIPDPDAAFLRILEEIRNDFVRFRYAFEGAKVGKFKETEMPWMVLKAVRDGTADIRNSVPAAFHIHEVAPSDIVREASSEESRSERPESPPEDPE